MGPEATCLRLKTHQYAGLDRQSATVRERIAKSPLREPGHAWNLVTP